MDEFTVRAAPSSSDKNHNVFKLHRDDVVTWTEAKMRRENEFQPWQIKIGSGRTGRRFKAIKEGGVGDNASYYIFYKPKDSSDTYEACPVEEWYNVSATQRYKTLTAEEAELKFEKRHKTLNMFSVMPSKKNGDLGEEGLSGSDSKAFKVSELDDWDNSGDEFDGSGDENNGGSDDDARKRRKKNIKKEKDDPDEAPDEGKEDSDEGDFEQREVDYMSDSSSDSSDEDGQDKEGVDVKGIAEEEALRDLLSTDDEEEINPVQKGLKVNSNKNTLGTIDLQQDADLNGSEDSSDSDDYDVDEDKMDSMIMKKGLPAQLVKSEVKQESSSAATSNIASNATISATNQKQPQQSAASKRKAAPIDTSSAPGPSQSPPKRPCPPESSSSSATNSQEKTIEDLIVKYLSRKPMTLKTLLKDTKSKLRRMGTVTAEMDNELVNMIASIIKRLNPERQKINDVTYFSLKAE